ncbi:MAG TPA: GspH/FimT family pseudopilin [Blastocatellia bacterium]|nr:GspH/FimT family pseudopilin [Blastocatellia bacterium]
MNVDLTRRESGFSAVEVTVVMLIIGILVAISLPAMSNSISKYNLRNAANHIAERLSYARGVAMEKNRDVGVTIRRDGEYGFDFDADGTIDTVDPDDPTQTYFSLSLPDFVSIPSSFFPPDKDYILIRFNSRGELPIGDPEANVEVQGSSGSVRLRVNLRGKVWVS